MGSGPSKDLHSDSQPASESPKFENLSLPNEKQSPKSVRILSPKLENLYQLQPLVLPHPSQT